RRLHQVQLLDQLVAPDLGPGAEREQRENAAQLGPVQRRLDISGPGSQRTENVNFQAEGHAILPLGLKKRRQLAGSGMAALPGSYSASLWRKFIDGIIRVTAAHSSRHERCPSRSVRVRSVVWRA